MFERLKRTLASAGAELEDVVELQTFHTMARDTEGFQKEFAVLQKVHHEYFLSGYPALRWVRLRCWRPARCSKCGRWQ